MKNGQNDCGKRSTYPVNSSVEHKERVVICTRPKGHTGSHWDTFWKDRPKWKSKT